MRRLILSFVSALLASLASSGAHAQSAEKAAAAQLFDDAQALSAHGEMAKACPKFQESHRLDPQLGTLLYLSDCYAKLGKTASAWASFRDAVEIAAKRGDSREASARARVAELEKRLSRLTIELPSDPPAGLQVTRDGALVAKALIGSAIPVDPGTIVIDAKAEGFDDWQTRITVPEESSNIHVQVPRLTPKASVPLAAPPAETQGLSPSIVQPVSQVQSSAPVAPYRNRRLAGYLVAGTGLVALGVGTTLGLLMKSTISERRNANACSSGEGCTEDQERRVDHLTNEAKSYALGANIGFAVGGAALVTGAILVATTYLSSSSSSSSSSVALGPVQPWVRDKTAGLSLGATF